jgi:hypothetical protein
LGGPRPQYSSTPTSSALDEPACVSTNLGWEREIYLQQVGGLGLVQLVMCVEVVGVLAVELSTHTGGSALMLPVVMWARTEVGSSTSSTPTTVSAGLAGSVDPTSRV